MSYNPYSPYEPPGAGAQQGAHYAPSPPKKQSGLGIASIVVAIVSGLAGLAAVVMSVVLVAEMEGQAVDEESMEIVVVGLVLFAVPVLSMIGIGLAIGGFVQPNRYRVCPTIGVIINTMIVLGFCGLIAIGLVMGG